MIASTLDNSTASLIYDNWSEPELVDTVELEDSIELIYKQYPMFTYTVYYPLAQPEARIFKIVFSCKKGKWHKSERIYGKVIAASEESYVFSED